MSLVNFSNIQDTTTIDAADVNSPLNTIYNDYNGNIDSSNIKDGSLDSSVYGTGSVGTPAIADGSVTVPKLGVHIKKGLMEVSVFNNTGNHSITGVGFKPSLVEFEVLYGYSPSYLGFSTGSMSTDGTQSWSAISGKTTASFRNSSKTQCIAYLSADDGTVNIQGSFVSMDADGFTFSTASAGSSFEVSYKAYA